MKDLVHSMYCMKEGASSFVPYLKIVTIVAVLIFSSVLVVGVNIGSLNSHSGSSTGGCLFDISEKCLYGFTEHLIEWQDTFNISPEQNILSLVKVLLLFLGTLLVIKTPSNRKYQLLEWCQKNISIFVRRNILTKLFDYIRAIFSSGILHPKLF